MGNFLTSAGRAMVGCICPLACLTAMAAGLYWLVRWVLGPLDNAARNRQHPTQFTIADFLCLFFLLQVSLAGVYAAMGPPDPTIAPTMWGIGIFLWVATGLVWAKIVQILSRAGIRRPGHRAALLVFVWPVTLVSAATAPVLPIVTVGMFISLATGPHEGDAKTAFLLAIFLPVAIGGLWVCAKLTRHIVAVAASDPPEGEHVSSASRESG